MATASPFSPEALSNRAVIALEGEGVLSFLHNILTCDVETLIQGEIAYGALLSPQGKILHDLFVHQTGAKVFLDCDSAQREALIAKLKLYRLRAKFMITPRDDVEVMVGGEGFADPRHAGLGARRIMPRGSAAAGGSYDSRRFALGIADSAEIGSGRLFPHEANFDQFGGVDFNKGCYIGQEVVSRMQHRATARSRILPLMFADDQYADEIRSNETLLGEVLGRHGKQALALLRLDRLAELEVPLPFIVVKPDWAKFEAKLP